jgi:Subtilase family/Putative Ig domain
MGQVTVARVGSALAALALLAGRTALGAAALEAQHAAQPLGTHPLAVFGGRTVEQLHTPGGAKLDAALADLVRHASRVRPQHALADLHALSPAARFSRSVTTSQPLISIDAVTRGDVRKLEAALVGLGLEHPAIYANDVGGWLPVSQINAAAARTEVTLMRAALSRTRAAALATQGDFAQASDALRTAVPTLSGNGITVGVLSDSFDCYAYYENPANGVPASGNQGYAPNGFAGDNAATDATNGYLPASVTVLAEAPCADYGAPLQTPFADEGRAMLQIVHVVAPQAALAFYTASNSEADFAGGIGQLASAGAKVIADDVGYFDEPFFQDGLVAQAIDAVAAQGVVYFSAAGNNSRQSYETTTPNFNVESNGAPNKGELLLSYDSAGATALPVQIPEMAPGEFIGLILEWDQPYVTGAAGSSGATSQLDLCVTGTSSEALLINLDGASVNCTGPNTIGTDPVQILILANPANASGNTPAQSISILVGLANGTTAPGRVKLVVYDDGAGSVIDARFATSSPSVQGHPGAAGAAAVGAAYFARTPLCGTSPAVLESYSSSGGDPILFDTSGARLAIPLVRQKPNFTAPDGVNTSFFGFFIAGTTLADDSTVAECADNATYLNFFGTSAATPHAAGIAALALQSIPTLKPSQVIGALQASAVPMSGTTPNFDSGYGFLQASALASPVVWFPGSAVSLGNSATLSWVTLAGSGCSASGAWSGAQPSAGTLTVTPSATGSSTYTLTCTGAAGAVTGSATLTAVTALAITTTALPAATAGSSYSASLAASGGVPPYSWSLAGSPLPSGLTLNGGTGVISGTAASASANSLSISVTDAENPPFSKSTTLSLSVAAAPASKSTGGGGGGGGALGALSLLLLCARLLGRIAPDVRRAGRAPTSSALPAR